MGFHNPRMPWSELESALSSHPAEEKTRAGARSGSHPAEEEPRAAVRSGSHPAEEEAGAAVRSHPAGSGASKVRRIGKDDGRGQHPVVDPLAVDADGGDSPVWSRKRQPYQAPPLVRPATRTVPYAELHCHTNFSFLDGASHPEELAEEAARLGLTGLAVTDHDGFYGVVRFSEAAGGLDLPTVFGAELSLGLTRPQNGEPDPRGAAPAGAGPGRGRVRRAGPGHRGGAAGRRREGQTGLRPSGAGRRAAERPRGGADRVPQGHRPARARHRRGRGGGPGARPAGRAVRCGARGGGADRPRRPVRRRPQRRAPRAGAEPAAARRGHQQRALCDAGPAAAGHRPGRDPGPAQPRRDRRLAARGRHRASAQRRRDGPPVRRLSGRGGARRGAGRGARLRPASWSRRSCPPSRSPSRGTPR